MITPLYPIEISYLELRITKNFQLKNPNQGPTFPLFLFTFHFLVSTYLRWINTFPLSPFHLQKVEKRSNLFTFSFQLSPSHFMTARTGVIVKLITVYSRQKWKSLKHLCQHSLLNTLQQHSTEQGSACAAKTTFVLLKLLALIGQL